MARATRSSAHALSSNSQPIINSPQKKRKRISSDEHDHPQPKFPRIASNSQNDPPINHVFLTALDAQRILDVLEMIDTQGLLDRVFPLPSSASSQPSHSLRSLLKHSEGHPISVLQAAVQHLLPLFSHPRSRPSFTAAQQLSFCNLTLSLLEQVSCNVPTVPPDIESILSSSAPDKNVSSPKLSPVLSKNKYALMQHLPSGDYWSSLDSDVTLGSTCSTSSAIKNLHTGHAELVSILPSSSSSPFPVLPTLGSLHTIKPAGSKKALPSHRRVTTGAFLDYGIWASFAPTFDQEGEVVGQRELGEAIYYRTEKKRGQEALRRKIPEASSDVVDEHMENGDGVERGSVPDQVHVDMDAELEYLFPPEQIEAIKAAIADLNLEDSIQELLLHNKRALQRLSELQARRLLRDGGSNEVEENSEEWQTAQAIMESLTILASLRPRGSDAGVPSLVPPPFVLQKLHRTLALQPSAGWMGTLPTNKTIALHDDSTMKLHSGAASAPVPAPAPPTVVTPAPQASGYAGYAYAYANPQHTQQAYRPGTATTTPYAQYKPGQSSAYYQGYIAAGAQQQGYYGQQAYAAGATGQQPYAATGQQPYAAFTTWYSQYQAPHAAGTGSGRGTPQPGVPQPSALPTSYGNFFNAATAAGAATPPPPAATRSPAVANTVSGAKGTGTAVGTGWATGVPTLPAHLRNGGQGMQAGGYYGQYQR